MIHSALVIEDDKALQSYIKELLTENGYTVVTADDGVDGLQKITEKTPDIVLLDLNLPKISGESVCRSLRKDYPDLPIIILTAKDTVNDVVNGLNLGADDYMTKPFDAEVLVARMKARLRAQGAPQSVLQVADLTLNSKTLEITRAGQSIVLSPHEFKILQYLMANKNQVLTRDMIINRVWFDTPEVETRIVDVYIGYLRKKIDADHERKLIHSARGFGYMIKD
jgi:DNA-binding response OmpR family regulator